MIETTGLSKAYGDTQVLQDVGFCAPTSTITGFLGANGAGKTTAMRLMLGLEVGDGTTRYDGRLLQAWPDPGRVVGAVVDAGTFAPGVPVVRQLTALAHACGVDPRSRPAQVLELVGLSEVAGAAPRTFSLGMKQRLGLAAALLGDPRVLILDEPANGLDPPSILWLRRWLRGLADEGRTVLLSSHLLSELQLLADRVVVLAGGRVVAEQDMASFLARGPGEAVRVETPDHELLLDAAAALGAVVEPDDAVPGAYRVLGTSRQLLAEQLWSRGARLSLLASEARSLEDAYLDVAGLGAHAVGQLT